MAYPSPDQLRAEANAAHIRTAMEALGDVAAREARREGPSPSGVQLVREITLGRAATALRDSGIIDERAASAIALALLTALESFAGSMLQLEDADRARAERNASFRAEEQAKERADREREREAHILLARRLGREARRRFRRPLDHTLPLDHVVQLATSQYPYLAEHESSIRAGFLDEDERIAAAEATTPPTGAGASRRD